MNPYPNLFSPLEIGPITVRNRIMQTAHVKLFAQDGIDTERNVAYQVERARGGAGLLITGNRLVHPTSTTGFPRAAFAYLKGALEIDRRMTAGVHEHGAKIFTQLNHFGLNAASDVADDLRVLWGPSAVKSPAYGETPKVMEHEDIAEVVEWWARSAELSRDAGFDGTEVHISHSYLLHQFLSPLYNKRTDEYGGSLENRLRFSREVIDAVRARTGDDWAVGVRISLSDVIPGALDLDDAIAVTRLLEADGRIDYVNVSAAGYHNIWHAIQPSDEPDGYLVEMAAAVKAATSLPVFTVGGIKDPELAEEILAAGKADMVAMTRGQIADPELANKAREGRADEITRCIRGNQGCIARVFKGQPISCTVNPAAGREGRFGVGTLKPAATPGHWVVVGAGPAGMRAAGTLALRGHRVTLLERDDQVGGQVRLIVASPGRAPFGSLAEDLERRLGRAGVTLRTGVEATAESVLALEPDGVIVATGALPSRSGFSSVNPLAPGLAGADRANVCTTWEIISGAVKPTGRVVLLDDDGTRHAASAAEMLLDGGAQLELVTRFNALLPSTAVHLDIAILYNRLFTKGLVYRLNSWASGFDGETLGLFNMYTGAPDTITGVDQLVLACGSTANDGLYFALKGRVGSLHRIGDCLAPRKLDHAVYEGELAGRELFDANERYIYEGELEAVPEGAC